MSFQVTEAFRRQYQANVDLLSQQKGSKLRKAVRVETVKAQSAFFEQIGSATAQLKTSRHADTPQIDTPHQRRRVTLSDYVWADLIDNEDQIRMLIDPTSPYAEVAAMAMGRKMDELLIAAADATAYTGVDGTTSTSYDSNMTIAVTERWPGVTSADYGLNVAKILSASEKLAAANVDSDDDRWLVINARQRNSLLKDTHVSSYDYNEMRPLQSGQVAKFGGFNIIMTELLGTSSGNDKVLYFAKGGLLLGLGKDINVRVSERPDKNYATQVFSSMSIGATRMEEARVGVILCHPTNGPGA